MQYTTIVEKNEEGLNLILEAARQFCEERFLHSVFSNNMTKYEILRLTSHVNTRQSRFSEEIISLVTFANKWLDSYATDNNSCYDTAERMLNKIRVTISVAKKVYKATCRRTTRQVPNRVNCSVFNYSE